MSICWWLLSESECGDSWLQQCRLSFFRPHRSRSASNHYRTFPDVETKYPSFSHPGIEITKNNFVILTGAAIVVALHVLIKEVFGHLIPLLYQGVGASEWVVKDLALLRILTRCRTRPLELTKVSTMSPPTQIQHRIFASFKSAVVDVARFHVFLPCPVYSIFEWWLCQP